MHCREKRDTEKGERGRTGRWFTKFRERERKREREREINRGFKVGRQFTCLLVYIVLGHPWYSGIALDCWSIGQGIDLAPGA